VQRANHGGLQPSTTRARKEEQDADAGSSPACFTMAEEPAITTRSPHAQREGKNRRAGRTIHSLRESSICIMGPVPAAACSPSLSSLGPAAVCSHRFGRTQRKKKVKLRAGCGHPHSPTGPSVVVEVGCGRPGRSNCSPALAGGDIRYSGHGGAVMVAPAADTAIRRRFRTTSKSVECSAWRLS
jgi:hypothetical protein